MGEMGESICKWLGLNINFYKFNSKNKATSIYNYKEKQQTCKTFNIGLTVFQVVPLMSITTENPKSAASSL